jgi:hypothetical protein
LNPGLAEAMDRGPGLDRAHQRDGIHLVGNLWHQALREHHAAVRGRVHEGRCPGAGFEIERVSVAGAALHKDKDAILSRADGVDRSLGDGFHGARGQQEIAADGGGRVFKEEAAAKLRPFPELRAG